MRSLGTCPELLARPRVRGAITTRLGSKRSPSRRGCSNGGGISLIIDKKPIGLVRVAPIRRTVNKYFAPISSLIDNRTMGRRKNFSREGVLEKALPVFWRRGFADASLHELE